jgi:hypothetical protein
VKAQGTGGLSEFKANLGESLAWGGFKCIAVDNREVGSTTRDDAVPAAMHFSLLPFLLHFTARLSRYLPSLLHTWAHIHNKTTNASFFLFLTPEHDVEAEQVRVRAIHARGRPRDAQGQNGQP